jgi:hypothetical protein
MIYRDQWSGRQASHVIERDDGLVDTFESAAMYFEAPRSEPERVLLDRLTGPVLDLGCGAGAHTLYLQQRGLRVTAVDASAGAVDVCRARGCADARVMDVRWLELPPGEYRGIITMGNTLGVHQTPETLPKLFATLRHSSTDQAHLVCTTLDPLETEDPVHLEYHRKNRERGLPPGLTTIRMKYRDLVGDWAPLWLLTTQELEEAVSGSGWELESRRALGPYRIDLYAAAAV